MAKFRAVKESDKEELDTWIAADPGHAGRVTSEFFLTPGKYHSLCAVEDEQGTVMYLRLEGEMDNMRAHIQFCSNRKRIMKTFREGFPFVMADARARGFKAVVFDSCSPALVRWMIFEFHFLAEMKAVL